MYFFAQGMRILPVQAEEEGAVQRQAQRFHDLIRHLLLHIYRHLQILNQ
jgi:hypothetical protein